MSPPRRDDRTCFAILPSLMVPLLRSPEVPLRTTSGRQWADVYQFQRSPRPERDCDGGPSNFLLALCDGGATEIPPTRKGMTENIGRARILTLGSELDIPQTISPRPRSTHRGERIRPRHVLRRRLRAMYVLRPIDRRTFSIRSWSLPPRRADRGSVSPINAVRSSVWLLSHRGTRKDVDGSRRNARLGRAHRWEPCTGSGRERAPRKSTPASLLQPLLGVSALPRLRRPGNPTLVGPRSPSRPLDSLGGLFCGDDRSRGWVQLVLHAHRIRGLARPAYCPYIVRCAIISVNL